MYVWIREFLYDTHVDACMLVFIFFLLNIDKVLKKKENKKN